ncbi:hypothetical protein [Mycobacterium malmoense]|uniref:hypothetical protein n=1 Tax=Mycobacterium malmoense TaxID=1780 RepID=UPI00159EC5F4|nr:hypothetical protein [Mycobacterium malmoense]
MVGDDDELADDIEMLIISNPGLADSLAAASPEYARLVRRIRGEREDEDGAP